ncbi:sensor histidine kinase [Longitalea luteola]|uniref:sensor histidine kinase n=1 Tax=Longitalea luteola TaxID=2812563 RepID=UPI001A96B935|nr:histidine kinase [Longitalea luteola]
MNDLFQPNYADLLLRALYIFFIAVLFFIIHLQTRIIKAGFIKIDLNSFWQRLPLSVGVFFITVPLFLQFHKWLFPAPANEQIFRFLFNLNMSMSVIMTILFAQIFRLLIYNYQIRLTNASLLKANAETRFEVLKNQVNPHFLFNAFNTINSLIMTDQQAAVHYVNNMSEVYRYVLKSHEQNAISLQEELHFVEAYINMLKGRYGNKVQFEVNVLPVYNRHKLPPMALQILLENAVKHNIASRSKPLFICIVTTREGGLVVANNLQKRPQTEASTGLGLQNLNQRCKYLSNHDLIIQQTESSFSVTIPLLNE